MARTSATSSRMTKKGYAVARKGKVKIATNRKPLHNRLLATSKILITQQ